MSLAVTLSLLALAGLALGLLVWRDRRPYVPGAPPLVPRGLVQFVLVLAIFILLAHLISLLTGVPFRGRFG